MDLELNDGSTPLIHAALKSEPESMTALVQRGADVEYENKKDAHTPLMAAAASNRCGSISTLCEYCYAKPDHESASGMTALMLAAVNGHVDALARLVQHGAQVNVENKNGESAFVAAARANQVRSLSPPHSAAASA